MYRCMYVVSKNAKTIHTTLVKIPRTTFRTVNDDAGFTALSAIVVEGVPVFKTFV